MSPSCEKPAQQPGSAFTTTSHKALSDVAGFIVSGTSSALGKHHPLCSNFCPYRSRIWSFPPRTRRNSAAFMSVESPRPGTVVAYPEVLHVETDNLLEEVEAMLGRGETIGNTVMKKMVQHLGDSRGMARLSLVEAFGRIGREAVDALLTGLRTCSNPVIRRSCGKALAKIGDDSATDLLIETLLNDVDTVTRASAAGALAKMGIAAVPKLLAVLSSSGASMNAKGHAAWAISFMQGAAAEILFERARDPSLNVRIAVISALAAVAIGDTLPTLQSSDNNNDDWPLADNIDNGSSVVQDNRQRAIETLTDALSDESPEVRCEAATGLANAGAVGAAPFILNFLNDPDLELRRTSALALMKLGHEGAIEKLLGRANDASEVESVRNVARLAAVSIQRKVAERSSNESDNLL